MKIVLLPGLDGTGLFFKPLLSYLDQEQVTIIPLPSSGDQSYENLMHYVQTQLPTEDFILVAESFSGPIAAHLAKIQLINLKAIIFVATFISPPKRYLLGIFSNLPIKLLLTMPFSSFFIRKLLLEKNASKEDVKYFQEIVLTCSSPIIKQRLESILTLSIQKFNSNIPAFYIRAEKDRLVPASKFNEFKIPFKEIRLRSVAGPHFILQSKSKECAEIINAINQSM